MGGPFMNSKPLRLPITAIAHSPVTNRSLDLAHEPLFPFFLPSDLLLKKEPLRCCGFINDDRYVLASSATLLAVNARKRLSRDAWWLSRWNGDVALSGHTSIIPAVPSPLLHTLLRPCDPYDQLPMT